MATPLLRATIVRTLFLIAPMIGHSAEEEAPSAEVLPGNDGGGRLDGKTALERGAALVRFVASYKPDAKQETYPKAAAPAYAARLLLKVDTAYALSKLDAAVTFQIAKFRQKPGTLDPFDKVALVNTYFLCKDSIPKATAAKIRDYAGLYSHRTWKGYGAWNYRLMMDGAGFLAAEEWPELVDQDGLDAGAIRAATKERLLGYFADISTKNYSEYGCPIYSAVNLSAVRMLAEYAKDPVVSTRAALTLDAMMVDIACTWNQGYNIGTAARAKYWASTNTGLESMGSTASAAWIFFGAIRPIAAAGTGWLHSFWMATPGKYKVPELIVKIAQHRSRPFVTRSYLPGVGKDDVHRITFHSLNYGLCSQWDHPGASTSALYKESRRNMLKWVSDKPSSTFAVCMENPYRPYNLRENRANVLGYGENPFSQYMQESSTLLGLYAVPEDFPYFKMYAPFPTTGSILKRLEKAGWVFCHNGSMLMGFRSVKPCAWAKKPWSGNDMLWCEARKNGWVLETSELSAYAGGGVDAELSRFAQAVLAKTRLESADLDGPAPHLVYTSLTGKKLDFTWIAHNEPYVGQSKVDGKPLEYKEWPMFDNSWVHQEVAVPVLKLAFGSQRLTYDFARWTRESTP